MKDSLDTDVGDSKLLVVLPWKSAMSWLPSIDDRLCVTQTVWGGVNMHALHAERSSAAPIRTDR
jgi:hypothetical protein